MNSSRTRGHALALVTLLLALSLGALLAVTASALGSGAERDAATERALAQAREALLAYAADRAIDREVGPGYLPCPDRDGDGWAEPTCGSLAGDVGQGQRLGALPWKTLGLPELRDGHGERLWYAVSTRHKGLLNCAASRACVDMTPSSGLGTITVRDAGGALLNDGRSANALDPRPGAAAVVIAPGPPLARADAAAREQRRDCAGARCDPEDFLDVLPGVDDNARFVDRSDAAGRELNLDGFVAGPALRGDRVAVNDRLGIVGYGDLMPRVMARVALEAAHCVRLRAALEGGQLPPPAPACDRSPPGEPWGRVPDVELEGCNLGAASAPGWWKHWRPHVLYGVAPRCSATGECIDVADGEGRVLTRGRRLVIAVSRRPGTCGPEPFACDATACRSAVNAGGGDVVLAFP